MKIVLYLTFLFFVSSCNDAENDNVKSDQDASKVRRNVYNSYLSELEVEFSKGEKLLEEKQFKLALNHFKSLKDNCEFLPVTTKHKGASYQKKVTDNINFIKKVDLKVASLEKRKIKQDGK